MKDIGGGGARGPPKRSLQGLLIKPKGGRQNGTNNLNDQRKDLTKCKKKKEGTRRGAVAAGTWYSRTKEGPGATSGEGDGGKGGFKAFRRKKKGHSRKKIRKSRKSNARVPKKRWANAARGRQRGRESRLR